VLATGEPRGGGRWHARATRDFALAIGRFKTLATTIAAPRRVRVTVGVEQGSPFAARSFLNEATRVLRLYAERYGEYPWSTYSLAVMRDYEEINGTALPASVRNRIGEPMSFWAAHDFETMRLGLHVQSAQALAALGSASTVNCALWAFVVRNAYRTTSPDDLLAALEPFPDARQKLSARGAHF